MGKRMAAVAIVGSLLGGAGVGAVLFGASGAVAQSSSSTTAPGSSTTTPGGTGGANGSPVQGCGPGGIGGPHETVSDTSVAAAAIGISESDLTSALASGQTIAQVAQSHNVNIQKVIDALVADAKTELADQVKAGTITQAQADQMQSGITQRVTDQVNGAFGGPRHFGHPGGFNPPPSAPGASA